MKLLPRICVAFLLALLAHAQFASAKESPPVDASSSVSRTSDAAAFRRHESILARGKFGPIGLLFIGDSITEGWLNAPDIWQKFYGKWHPANFGVSGDRTQNVIWRIENGELDGTSPKVVVLMLGTNNTLENTSEQILAADVKITNLVKHKLPEAKILLLAIFPRGPRSDGNGTVDPYEKRMTAIRNVNAGLAKLDDGRSVRFLDIGAKFYGADGKIPVGMMPDQLHPSPAGYAVWAEAMQPLLEEMMR